MSTEQDIFDLQINREVITHLLRPPSTNPETTMQAMLNLLERSGMLEGQLQAQADLITDETGLPRNTLIEPIGSDAWQQSIASDQPTFAARVDTLPGAGLLALAADHIRTNGERICNVALLPDAINSREFHNRRGVFAYAGFIISQRALYGTRFPDALQIDGSHSLHNAAIVETKAVRLLNDPGIETLANNKQQAHQKFTKLGLPTVQSLHEGTVSMRDQSFNSFIAKIHATVGHYVIKPPAGSRGEGVLLFDNRTDTLGDVLGKVSDHYTTEEPLLIERKVQCYPAQHEVTGAILDWNIRTLLVGGRPVGVYARAGVAGTPINVSRGATKHALQEIFEMCKLSYAQTVVIEQRLNDLYHSTYNGIPAGIMGLDIIIDQHLQPILIEVNGELSGGLSTVTNLGRTSNIDPAIAALRNIDRTLFGRSYSRKHTIYKGKNRPLPLNSDVLLTGLYDPSITTDPANLRAARTLVQDAIAGAHNLPHYWQESMDGYLLATNHLATDSLESLEQLQETLPGYKLTLFKEYFKRGDHSKAYNTLNDLVTSDPFNYELVDRCNTALLEVMDTNDLPSLFTAHNLTPSQAGLYARFLLMQCLDFIDLPPTAFSQQGQVVLVTSLTAMFESEAQRTYCDISSSDLPRDEKIILLGLTHYINAVRSAQFNDSVQAFKLLNEALMTQTEGDSLLASIYADYLVTFTHNSVALPHAIQTLRFAAGLLGNEPLADACPEIDRRFDDQNFYYIQIACHGLPESTAAIVYDLFMSIDDDDLTSANEALRTLELIVDATNPFINKVIANASSVIKELKVI